MVNIELNKIILADCMDIMKDIPDKYFELAIVDPPYGIKHDRNLTAYGKAGKSFSFNKNKINHLKKNWDDKIPDECYFFELFRISKNQIIWGANNFSKYIPSSTGWIYWDKKITNKNNKNFSDGELAFTSFNKRLIKFEFDWIGFGYLNSNEERKIHPTQKPVALYRWLLQNYAKTGDKIIDTHSGSGSLACACLLEKFDFLAIEKDEDYYNDSVKRFNELKSQGVLF